MWKCFAFNFVEGFASAHNVETLYEITHKKHDDVDKKDERSAAAQ